MICKGRNISKGIFYIPGAVTFPKKFGRDLLQVKLWGKFIVYFWENWRYKIYVLKLSDLQKGETFYNYEIFTELTGNNLLLLNPEIKGLVLWRSDIIYKKDLYFFDFKYRRKREKKP